MQKSSLQITFLGFISIIFGILKIQENDAHHGVLCGSQSANLVLVVGALALNLALYHDKECA